MIRFSEMEYRRPDMEALKALVEEATRKVKEAGSSGEVKEAYFTLQEKELDADTMFTLAHIRNTIDTKDEFYDGENRWLRENYAQLTPVLRGAADERRKDRARDDPGGRTAPGVFENGGRRLHGIPGRKVQLLRPAEAYAEHGPGGAEGSL